MFKVFAAVMLVSLLSLSAAGCAGGASPGGGSGNASNSAPSPAATPTPATRAAVRPRPTATPVSLTADLLQREHKANKLAWMNKLVLVTGVISSITEAGDQYDVKLDTDNAWVDIVCKVSRSDAAMVLELRAGETATVYGRVTNYGVIDIVVRDCVIRRSGGG